MIKNEAVLPLSVRSLCMTAVMAAFICLMTAVPRVPIPLGYAHLGDAAIFLVVLYMGHKEGAVAASLGSAMADLIGGFPLWVIPTIIIKYGMALILWQSVQRLPGADKIMASGKVFSMVLATLWMVLGYTVAGSLLYGGVAVGLKATPGLALKGAFNILLAVGAGIMLERAGLSVSSSDS